jgi:uncharacterized protein (TIGR03435 family)
MMRVELWMNVRGDVRRSTAIDLPGMTLPRTVRVRAVPGIMEPGVVGFWRPVLLLPAGIATELTPSQLRAVVAHEYCHIRRRDNVTAALHMLVEAVFWFHPLVWWIGARLIHERERACDEHVLRTYGDPRSYADGILSVCRRYVETQLACVAGVGSSDLKARIEAIMRNETRDALGTWKALGLATAGTVTIAVPILAGSLSASPLRSPQSASAAGTGPAFEVASVKRNTSGGPGWRLDPEPGGRLTATNVRVAALIRFAYDQPAFQVFGGPDWLDNERFDVIAKAEGDPPVAQKRLMLRRLLEERFNLAAHAEIRDLPIYALTMARADGRLGPNLRRAIADCTQEESPTLDDAGFGPGAASGATPCGFFGLAPGTNMPAGSGGLAFRGVTIATLTKALVPVVRRSVVDETGLTGYFDADFDFVAELPPPPPPPGMPNPWDPFLSVFTVLPEQLGLKLDSKRGPVEVLVIDSVERPTPD